MPSRIREVRARARSKSGSVSVERLRLDRELDDLGAGRAHRARSARQVGGRRRRSRAATARCRGRGGGAMMVGDELGARFDVDELGAGVAGRPKDPPPLFLGPWKPPPSHAARQVTMTGRRRPSSAPATSGRSTRSRRSSTRSASDAASRARRSSSIVGPVTVTHSCGSRMSVQKRKKPPQPWAEEAFEILSCVVQASGSPPQRTRTTTNRTQTSDRRDTTGRAATASKRGDNNRGARRVSIVRPRRAPRFSLTCKQLALITGS